MFQIGKRVQYGVRFRGHGSIKGGIARQSGVVIAKETVRGQELLVVKHTPSGVLHNFRQLKNGWVIETEPKDDPKGRLYLKEVA